MTTEKTPHHDDDNDARNDFLMAVLEDHAPVLRAIFKGQCRRDYEDAFQEFVMVVVIQRDLLSKLQALQSTDGQQRRLLRKAASDFCVSWRRKDRTRRRAEEHYLPPESVPQLETLSQAWATEVLRVAFVRTRDHFNEGGHADHWTVFRERVVQPEFQGAEPTPIEEICQRTRFKNRGEVYSAIKYVKRRLRLELECVVVDRTGNEVTLKELQELFQEID